MQEPSSTFASVLKLIAASSVQPRTSEIQFNSAEAPITGYCPLPTNEFTPAKVKFKSYRELPSTS